MKKKDAPRYYLKGEWTKESLRVLHERYLAKDSRGIVKETPEGMCYRVARRIALVEKKFFANDDRVEELTRRFYEIMATRLFLPNSPTLMNAGRDDSLQYSACFVLPVGDSIPDIFDAVKYAALIHQSGGGTGFSFSRLRSRGSIVRSTRGIASGPVSFMRVFDAATAEIKQGGMRRGANMGILRVDHPDIEEFIESKAKGGITNFNISVAVTDKFMQAVKSNGSYWLYSPISGKRTKKLKAKQIFEKIAKMAWQSGDPGLIFIDRINAGSANPVPSMGPIEATNPCGEQPLYPNEACNLGSLNLSLMVKDQQVDWRKLAETVRLAVRFLDNVVEINPFPLPIITEIVRQNRRIGLGVMGWADLLFLLEIPYDSAQAIRLGKKIMQFIQKTAHSESQRLAKERGAFPNFPKSIYKNKTPLRNATLTTIAPTGSISIIADCSSGIEPAFALAFKHKTNGRELTFFNSYFSQAIKKYRLKNSLVEKVKQQGNLVGLEAPKKIKRIFVTAHEINWQAHIDVQTAFQSGVDNAVSKTINLPNESRVEEVEAAYFYSYQKGCLGITVYRDRCREQQVLYAGYEEEVKKELKVKLRPAVATGKTFRIKTPVGTAFITANINGNNNPLEVFVNIGKVGSDIAADAEAIGRLISLSLRLGSEFQPQEVITQIINQLEGIGGSESVGFGKEKVRSLADGIAKVLKEYLGGEKAAVAQTGEQPPLFKLINHRDLCPTCGQASLIFEEGCAKCQYCGYNKC